MSHFLLMPVSGQSAPEAIVRRVIEGLSSGELAPGEKLPREDELAKIFGVATMTLRSALSSLRELGFVETKRGRFGGSFIAEDVLERLVESRSRNAVTVEMLRSLTDWRRAISGEACYLAAERGTEEDFTAIREAADDFDSCSMEISKRRSADARLHSLIAAAAKSNDLLSQEQLIQEQLNIVILPQDTPALAKHTRSMQHELILEAIFARDGEKARREMIAHVESTFDWSCTLLTPRK